MTEADIHATEAARTATVRRKPVPVPQPVHSSPRKPTLVERWKGLSKRNRIIIISAVLALIILIIGLAAGLSTRRKTQNLPLPSGRGGPYTGDLTYYAPGLGACGVTSSEGDRIVDLTVVDRCTGCQPTDIDITMEVFATLADVDQGRVLVEWNWLEDVPANAQGL